MVVRDVFVIAVCCRKMVAMSPWGNGGFDGVVVVAAFVVAFIVLSSLC